MSEADDTAAWAKAHRASFDAEPLIEMKGSEKFTVGYTLDLYASLPMEKGPGEERREAAAALWERLRDLLQAAVAEHSGGKALVEIEPMRTAAVLRPENEMKPEVNLRARIVHKEAFESVTAEERKNMSAFEKKLSGLGLRAGHW